MLHVCADIVLLIERLSNPLLWLQAEMLGSVFYLNFLKQEKEKQTENNTFLVFTVPSKNYPVTN